MVTIRKMDSKRLRLWGMVKEMLVFAVLGKAMS